MASWLVLQTPLSPPGRLKSVGGNKTIDALLSLGCQRRVLLTGTPVQNDLQEFYGAREKRGWPREHTYK